MWVGICVALHRPTNEVEVSAIDSRQQRQLNRLRHLSEEQALTLAPAMTVGRRHPQFGQLLTSWWNRRFFMTFLHIIFCKKKIIFSVVNYTVLSNKTYFAVHFGEFLKSLWQVIHHHRHLSPGRCSIWCCKQLQYFRYKD